MFPSTLPGFRLRDEEILGHIGAVLAGSQGEARNPTDTLQRSADASKKTGRPSWPGRLFGSSVAKPGRAR